MKLGIAFLWAIFNLITTNEALKDGDCLGLDSFKYFTVSPGGYNPTKSMDPKVCKSRCADIKYPYAGVQGRFCLCSNQNGVEDLQPVEKDFCPSENGYTQFHKAQPVLPLKGVSLTTSESQVIWGQKVSFEITVEGQKGQVEYQIDYGDDSGIVQANLKVPAEHIYFQTGSFRITVIVWPSGGPPSYRLVTSTVLTVVTGIVEESVNLNCTPVIEPNEEFLCDLVLHGGENIVAEVDYGDGNMETINLPDASPTIMGMSVPQHKTIEMKPVKAGERNMILIPESEALRNSNVKKINVFATKAGELKVAIMRLKCIDNGCSPGIMKCLKGEQYCSNVEDCMTLGPSNQCPATRKKDYQTVIEVTVQVEQGFNSINPPKPMEVMVGDVIAFVPLSANIASRLVKPHELSDLTAPAIFVERGYLPFKELVPAHRRFYLGVAVDIPLALYLEHTYIKDGKYRMSTTLNSDNTASPIVKALDLNVQYYLKAVRLKIEPQNAIVDRELTIDTTLEGGSDVKVVWDFGDGKRKTELVPGANGKGTTLSRPYTYFEPGVYKVKVVASNLLGRRQAVEIVTVQFPITDTWHIDFPTDKLLLPGTMTMLLKYNEKEPLPTNASVDIEFGDEQFDRWSVPNKGPWVTKSFFHDYQNPGFYKILVKMANAVSQKEMTMEVEALRRITNFTTTTVHTPKKGKDHMPGYGKDKNKFPTKKPVTFLMDIHTGDVEYYIVELDNGTILSNSTHNITEFTFNEPGSYNITTYAFNHIQSKSTPVQLNLYVMEKVTGLDIEDNLNITDDDSDKRFEIHFDTLGTDTCMVVDFGDETPLRGYGDELTCMASPYNNREKKNKKDKEREKLLYVRELSNPFHLRYQYRKSGDMTVWMIAFNDVSDVQASYSFNVSDLNCKTPLPWIRNRVNNLDGAPEFIRAGPVLLYSGTIVVCNYTNTVIRKWEGFKVDNMTGKTTDKIDMSNLDSARKSNLYVPPFFLMPGVYKFRLTVNLSAPEMYPPRPLINSISTYVKILPSPIVVQMADGAQSRITRGWGQTLRLNPKEYSIDPDNVNNKAFKVNWYCRRLPFDILDRELEDHMHNLSAPITDRNEVDLGDDVGGCFGKGPGKLAVEGGSVVWNTTSFMKPNETYEIVSKLELSDRAPSWGAIRVVLLDYSPPAITVKCQTEILCYPHDPIGQKINPVRVGLIGLCSEDCEGELVYEWTLYGVVNETEELLPEATEYVVGANEMVMALAEDFFKQYYPLYGDFIAKLTVTNEEGFKGASDIFLHINQPPEDGNCTITPDTGKALLDLFSINCKGWVDPEGGAIEHYGFWSMNIDTGVTLFLSVGPDSKTKIVLPYGLFQLGVDIKDKEGALTRTNMTIMQTEAPTKQEYRMFMKDKKLENANASGDTGRMNQVSQALSSLMGIELVDDNTTVYDYDFDEEEPSNATNAYEKMLEEQAQTRVKMINSVGNVMNTDTLSDLEQIGSALTTIAGQGSGLDNDGKNQIINLLNKTVNLAAHIKVEAPQQLVDFCMYAVGTMGGVVARMSQQLVDGVVLPTDRAKGMDIEYNVEVPMYGEEEPEYLFDGSIPVEEALTKAVLMKEREAAEGQIKDMVDLTIKLVLTILRNIIVGEKPMEFMAPSGLGLTISMYKNGALSNRTIKHGDASYHFPDTCDILATQGCSGNETIGIMAVSWPSILQSYGDSVDLLSNDTATLQLVLLDENMNMLDISNATDMFGITVPRGSKGAKPLPPPTYVYPQIKWNEEMIYHQFIVDKADSVINIEITPEFDDAKFMIYFNYREKPQLNMYELLIPLQDVRKANGTSKTFDIFLSNEVVKNRTGFFYLGVVELNDSYTADLNWGDEVNLTDGEVVRQFSTNYSVRIFTSGCYFFNPDWKIWSGAGCYVENANAAVTVCKCNHLTSFGGGFFVMPNAIDFSYVFANAGFADNITIYMTIIVTMSLYIIILIWARRQDKMDTEKLGAAPLADNDPADKYLYEVMVYTGAKEGAGTDSKVQFILSGEDDETDVRTLEDGKRKIFRRGEMDSFVMAVPRTLGRMTYIRIWHDNSGKGKFKSWFLSFIVVRDIQTNQKFEFICNKWLAVEKDDGQIDRLLPVAGKGEATEFSHLFNLTTQKNLADGHLWFSIFMRPPKSRFTRCQRVSCCWSLLYLSMLVNAMWYGVVPPKPGDSAISLGPLSLSPEQIGVGVMANLIVFPPSFLIITLFRKSRLRKLRPNRITEALRKQKIKSGGYDDIRSASRSTTRSTATLRELGDDDQMDGRQTRTIMHEPMMTKKKGGKKKKKPFMFPWWGRLVAWFLCIASMLISVFFLWAYGVTFGDEKTKKWVTSLLISFFSSILVTQPIKVFLMAMIFSSLFKSVDNDKDDSEYDEEEPELSPDEQWLHDEPGGKYERRRMKVKPVNVEAMQRAREEREKEMQMNSIIKEIVSYMFFLWILTILSYGNRDPAAFYLQNNLANHFINKGASTDDFSTLSTIDTFWNWTRHVLVPNVQVGKWYNGEQPFGLRGFLDDRNNRLMGYTVLRQVRVKPNSCKVPKDMQKVVKECHGFGSIIDEDKLSYKPGWKNVSTDDTVIDEYHYHTAKELDGLPFWAQLDVYGGGGYIIPIRGKREEIIENLHRIETSDWIDGGTRAIFIEFSVYNAQVNLFGICTFVVEFPPGGGVVPYHRIDAIRLMRYHQGFGLFVMICELTYVIYAIYFTVREVRLIRRDRVEYFESYWSYAELTVLGLSYGAIVVYVYRMIVTSRILKIFDKTHGNGYVKLQFVAAIDEIFGYLVSFLIFLAILKFIKLLRFNKRMGVLYSTLALCSNDLKSYFVVFWLIYFAFVQCFYVLFNTSLLDFASFVRTTETCFAMIQGKFDFESLILAAPVLGPLLFFVFAFVMTIVLLNIFITLVISAFESVKGDAKLQNNDFEIVDFMCNKLKGAIGFGGGNGDIDFDLKKPSIGEQIDEFPEKVDKLINYIDNMYFEGKMGGDNKGVLKKMVDLKHQQQMAAATGAMPKKWRNNKVHQEPQTPVFDWMQLPEDDQDLPDEESMFYKKK